MLVLKPCLRCKERPVSEFLTVIQKHRFYCPKCKTNTTPFFDTMQEAQNYWNDNCGQDFEFPDLEDKFRGI